jgi:hypothetical protein
MLFFISKMIAGDFHIDRNNDPLSRKWPVITFTLIKTAG